MKNKSFLTTFFCVLTAGCLSFSAQNKTNTSTQIKSLIAKKRAFNKKYGYGYRIQIYYGNETKARSMQSEFKIKYPDVYAKLDYNQPYWKVQVGNYKTRLEADKAMVNFTENFTGLIVIPLGK
jgi:outer membrane lipoprotein-sorting protein